MEDDRIAVRDERGVELGHKAAAGETYPRGRVGARP